MVNCIGRIFLKNKTKSLLITCSHGIDLVATNVARVIQLWHSPGLWHRTLPMTHTTSISCVVQQTYEKIRKILTLLEQTTFDKVSLLEQIINGYTENTLHSEHYFALSNPFHKGIFT